MITFRPYTPEDWDAICRVHDRARPDELVGSCDARAFVPLSDDPESKDIPEYQMLVACHGPAVVGFTGVRDHYIGWLYVDPAFYGRGIGRSLLKQAMALAGPEAWTVSLKGNAPALALYQSEGFRAVEEFDGDNAGYACTALRLSLLSTD